MKNKGFSLVELIIVIAIMAILAVAISPIVIRYIDKAKKSDDIASAEAIATAMKAAMANEETYSAVMEHDRAIQEGSTNTTTILLAATAGDTEWTITSDNADLDILKDELDETCPPPVIKFKKSVTASADPSHANSNYCLATYGAFKPEGWVVGINPDGEMCIFISNGKKDESMVGVAINPVECKDYK